MNHRRAQVGACYDLHCIGGRDPVDLNSNNIEEDKTENEVFENEMSHSDSVKKGQMTYYKTLLFNYLFDLLEDLTDDFLVVFAHVSQFIKKLYRKLAPYKGTDSSSIC